MTTDGTGSKHRTSATGDADQDAGHHSRVSKLFDKDHAYAARLVQIATAIRSVVRPTMTMNGPDQIPSEDDGTPPGHVAQPPARGSGGP